VFGGRDEGFAKVFYYYLAGGYDARKVLMNEFVQKLDVFYVG
jgi:hypothetical protein